MKILNLYAGLGGNRKLWSGDIEVTAVELCEKTAAFYKSQFPDDEVIIADAHEYLCNNYADFDFIWTSPPCQSHSRIRFGLGVMHGKVNAKYPDMSLYQEIIFLKSHMRGFYCVENVHPYYEPIIQPDFTISKHIFWTNINLSACGFKSPKHIASQIPELQKAYGFNLENIDLPDKRQRLRNCVLPELGKHVFDCMTGSIKKEHSYQPTIEDYMNVQGF